MTRTPSEWTVATYGDNKHDRYITGNAGAIIAQVYDYDMPSGHANCRLIAAAPRTKQERAILYQALRDVSMELHRSHLTDHQRIIGACQTIEAALALAEGGTP